MDIEGRLLLTARRVFHNEVGDAWMERPNPDLGGRYPHHYRAQKRVAPGADVSGS